MNIFVLDESPVTSAQMQCDKHIVKMPLETAQMLCSVWHRYGVGDLVPYKEVHKKHPCTLWAGDSMDNYDWLWQHGMELCFEYTRRYNKIHKCQQVIMDLEVYKCPFPFLIKDCATAHPQCMPDEYKCGEGKYNSLEFAPVLAYRQYYVNVKKDIAKWEKSRPMPNWFYDSDAYKVVPNKNNWKAHHEQN
jgi:hypothetical protein|tara:strand:- start:2214 stop:2783 length:570 start_codon:yes stop_codon:yes gene_type:complete